MKMFFFVAAFCLSVADIDFAGVIDFLFGSENFGFCVLMKALPPYISKNKELKKDKVRVLNVKFAGKRKSLDHFSYRR